MFCIGASVCGFSTLTANRSSSTKPYKYNYVAFVPGLSDNYLFIIHYLFKKKKEEEEINHCLTTI